MTQIRKIRAGWKSGSDQHRISAAIDSKLWNWLQKKPNKNRTINQALDTMKKMEGEQPKQITNLFGELKRELE